MAPENVNFYNSKEVYKRLYGKRAKRERAKLKKGDYVRMSRLLRFTDKSFENRWSRALYKVARGPFYPQHGERPMYEIEEIDTDEKIPGTFYELLCNQYLLPEGVLHPLLQGLHLQLGLGEALGEVLLLFPLQMDQVRVGH